MSEILHVFIVVIFLDHLVPLGELFPLKFLPSHLFLDEFSYKSSCSILSDQQHCDRAPLFQSHKLYISSLSFLRNNDDLMEYFHFYKMNKQLIVLRSVLPSCLYLDLPEMALS